mgnify:CR=1 FL=1
MMRDLKWQIANFVSVHGGLRASGNSAQGPVGNSRAFPRAGGLPRRSLCDLRPFVSLWEGAGSAGQGDALDHSPLRSYNRLVT